MPGIDELPEATLDRKAAEVYHWRYEQLRLLGVSYRQARELAATRLDVHELNALVGRGCPVDVALRILAPLD